MIKSEKAKKILYDQSHMDGEYTIANRHAHKAIIQAESDARERAVRAFYAACQHNKNGECHAFIVGYDTPDGRLHETCDETRKMFIGACEIKIDNFLKYYDNE